MIEIIARQARCYAETDRGAGRFPRAVATYNQPRSVAIRTAWARSTAPNLP